MIDLHYLELFHTIAKYESYKMAAEELHISQPALSIQIKKLEQQTHLKLFNKVGNRICLSDQGLMLQSYTIQIFSLVTQLEHQIVTSDKQINGTLHIGGSNTPGTYLIPELMGKFKELYPQVTFHLEIANTTEISHMVDNKTLDLAINGGNLTYDSTIASSLLYSDELLLVCSSNNPLGKSYLNAQKKEPVTQQDLLSFGFIVHKTDSQLFSYYRKFLEIMKLSECISMSLGNIDAIKQAVISDLGLSLMPKAAVEFELSHHILVSLPYQKEALSYDYHIIYNKNKTLSLTGKTFLTFLTKNV